jgi:hypothetical protein
MPVRERDYKAEYAQRKERMVAAAKAVAKVDDYPHIQPVDDIKGRVIGTLENGWTVRALETKEQLRNAGSAGGGPGGCMSSLDWITPMQKKAYRGLTVCDDKGKARAAVVLEWEDFQTTDKRRIGSGYYRPILPQTITASRTLFRRSAMVICTASTTLAGRTQEAIER